MTPKWKEEWLQQKEQKHKPFKKLINRLKKQRTKRLDQWVNQLDEQTFKQIDCLQCANCCTSIPPIVNETDTKRIAKHLNLPISDFRSTYLTKDEDGDQVINTSPCPFLLEDNRCDIYEVRPKACRQYPHTGNFDFSRNLNLHVVNAQYCPAVVQILTLIEKGLPK